jgi:predicted ATP-dependent endonuclease of OLD family
MADVGLRSIVLVEGPSDAAAVRALARRRGHDLDAEGVSIEAMGGYGNLGRFLQRYGPSGLDVRLSGLYDAPEERHSRVDLLEAVSARPSRAPSSRRLASMRATSTWRTS